MYARQPEVDSVMRAYLGGVYEQVEKNLSTTQRTLRLKNNLHLGLRVMALSQVRERIRCRGRCNDIRVGAEREKVELVDRVMRAAKTEVESWGGQLVFVYLPDWYYYARKYDSYGIRIDSNFLLRQDVLRTVHNLQVPVVDVQSHVFDASDDPLSLFDHRMYGHYTAAGYARIARDLRAYLADSVKAPPGRGRPSRSFR
jgi:hypothetical protein